MQTQIKLLPKKQSDQVFHVSYSKKHFVNSQPDNQFIWEKQEKTVWNLKHLP